MKNAHNIGTKTGRTATWWSKESRAPGDRTIRAFAVWKQTRKVVKQDEYKRKISTPSRMRKKGQLGNNGRSAMVLRAPEKWSKTSIKI